MFFITESCLHLSSLHHAPSVRCGLMQTPWGLSLLPWQRVVKSSRLNEPEVYNERICIVTWERRKQGEDNRAQMSLTGAVNDEQVEAAEAHERNQKAPK